LHRVLNPEAWKTRDTYLKVEATILDESKDSENKAQSSGNKDIYSAFLNVVGKNMSSSKKAENTLYNSFKDLVEKQHELEEDIRFTRASVSSLAIAPGNGEDGLWTTIRLWQRFIEQRLVARQNEMQKEFQEKLIDFLKKEKGVKEQELPRYVFCGRE